MALSLLKKAEDKLGDRSITAVAGSRASPLDDDPFSLDFTLPGALEGITVSEPAVQDEATGERIHPLIEQVAMLHAQGQDREAVAVLQPVLSGEDFGDDAERAWGMLFDLYQLLGDQQRFEDLAIDYAGRFEKSPPAWTGDDSSQVTVAGGKSQIALSGTLSARVEGPLKQLLQLAEKHQHIRIDLARIQDADINGCALLFDALGKLKRMKREYTLGGADKLAKLLAGRIAMGQPENEPIWQLLFELYQHSGQQQAFEDLAIEYAVAFEVSPPSWTPIVATSAPTKTPEPTLAPTTTEGYALEGGLINASEEAFNGLLAWAEGQDEVVVDVNRLTRMDFVSAGQLLNVLQRLHDAGRRVILRGASHLLAAFWEVMGVARVAHIEVRKR